MFNMNTLRKYNTMKNINRNAKVMFVLASLLVVFPLVKAERFKGDPIRKTNAPTQKAATCLPRHEFKRAKH